MTVKLAEARAGRFLYQDNDTYIGRSLDVYGEASEGELELLRQILRPGDWAVEAGANIGTIAVPMARHVGPQGRVILFEPQRLTYHLLCGNLALNELDNAYAHQVAVGAAPGVTRVDACSYGERFNYGSVRVGVTDGDPINIVTVDSLALPRLNLLMADVEGFEEAVLRGAAQTIARHRPAFYLENNLRDKSPSLLAHIFSLGYRVWWHLPAFFRRDNFRQVAQDIFGGMISPNILCLPQERAGTIKGLRPILSADDWWR